MHEYVIRSRTMLQFYLRMTANHAFRREFVLRRCTDWKYVHSSKGYTTRHLPLQRTSTPSSQNPSAETHVSLILEHVKLTIQRLDAYIVGYETSVYTSIRWRDPMILDITIHGYDMWPIHWPNVTGFHSEVFQIFHMQIFVTVSVSRYSKCSHRRTRRGVWWSRLCQ